MNAPKPILTLASILWTLAAPTPAPAADEPKRARLAAPVLHRTVKVDGLDIFYREAGPKDAPAVLLLHGFPTSSHMFRNLIPALADQLPRRRPRLPRLRPQLRTRRWASSSTPSTTWPTWSIEASPSRSA